MFFALCHERKFMSRVDKVGEIENTGLTSFYNRVKTIFKLSHVGQTDTGAGVTAYRPIFCRYSADLGFMFMPT
ncbi:MAG: hypothetical protein PVSMB11_03730 [Desulfuromonadaceae bacterium]